MKTRYSEHVGLVQRALFLAAGSSSGSYSNSNSQRRSVRSFAFLPPLGLAHRRDELGDRRYEAITLIRDIFFSFSVARSSGGRAPSLIRLSVHTMRKRRRNRARALVQRPLGKQTENGRRRKNFAKQRLRDQSFPGRGASDD